MSHPIQEEDKIAPAKIVLTSVVALVIFGVGALWAVTIQREQQGGLVQETRRSGPAVERAPEVGNVYQRPFIHAEFANDEEQLKTFANQNREPAVARLESYGWVDKKNNVVHIPIEKAMERYVQGAGK